MGEGRRRILGFVALALICALCAVGGAYVTVRAFGATVEPFTFGTVRVAAVPALEGRVDVPVSAGERMSGGIAAWFQGVAFHTFHCNAADGVRRS